MSEAIISLENVSKKYGSKTILKEINLEINPGQAVAFIGSNGSGKSTLLKMISGLVNVSSGSVRSTKKLKFNYIPENFPKLPLSAVEYLEFIRKMDKIPTQRFDMNCKELFTKFGMETMADIPMYHLSKGTLQKVVVIQALLSKPDVLLLDEPLSGQDIKSQQYFIEQVKGLLKENTTILMSCHEEFLIHMIASEVYEIKDQKLVPVSLEKIISREQMQITVKSQESVDNLKHLKGIKTILCERDQCDLIVEKKESNRILFHLIELGYEVIFVGGLER